MPNGFEFILLIIVTKKNEFFTKSVRLMSQIKCIRVSLDTRIPGG